jgi:hypothetical protein
MHALEQHLFTGLPDGEPTVPLAMQAQAMSPQVATTSAVVSEPTGQTPLATSTVLSQPTDQVPPAPATPTALTEPTSQTPAAATPTVVQTAVAVPLVGVSEGDSPIFAGFATKIGTVPVSAQLAVGPQPTVGSGVARVELPGGERVWSAALQMVADELRRSRPEFSLLAPSAAAWTQPIDPDCWLPPGRQAESGHRETVGQILAAVNLPGTGRRR